MKKITFLMILIIVLCVNIVNANSIKFRSGDVLNAEYSKNPVDIMNFDKLLLKSNKSKNYAVVYVRLSPGRTLSMFDYTLLVNNKSYSTIAIQKNYSGFQYTTDNLKANSENDIFSLLYFVDENMSNKNYTLKATFPPIEKNSVSVPFKNAPNGRFTESTLIKLNGNF